MKKIKNIIIFLFSNGMKKAAENLLKTLFWGFLIFILIFIGSRLFSHWTDYEGNFITYIIESFNPNRKQLQTYGFAPGDSLNGSPDTTGTKNLGVNQSSNKVPQDTTGAKYLGATQSFNNQSQNSFDSLINKILNHSSNILGKTSLIVTYIILFLTIITLLGGFAIYKIIREYNKLQSKVELVDENLFKSASLATSTLPELSYSFLTPEKFIIMFKSVSDIIEDLIKNEGESDKEIYKKILKFKGGARLLAAKADENFISGKNKKAIDIWETINDYRDCPKDIENISYLKLALCYKLESDTYHRKKKREEYFSKATDKLDKVKEKSRIYNFSLFLKYFWGKDINNGYINRYTDKIHKTKVIYFPEQIPLVFVRIMQLKKDENNNQNLEIIRNLTLILMKNMYEYIKNELKNANYNLVISWLATMLGLIVYVRDVFNKNNKSEETEYYTKLINFVDNNIEDLFNKLHKEVEIFWLPFSIENATIKKTGCFVNKEKIKTFITECTEKLTNGNTDK